MKKKKRSITIWIIAALILGIIFGIIGNVLMPTAFNASVIKWVLKPMGDVFLRGIKMVVIPLVLFSLICGTASMGDIKKLGRIGGKTLAFYLSTTAFAITLALIMANIFKPGMGVVRTVSSANINTQTPPFIMDLFVNMIPTNPVESLIKGDMLQIITFAVIFGAALTLLGKKGEPLIELFNDINDVFLKIIELVMLTAPFGVFALISQVVLTQGIDILLSLLKYFLVVVLTLVIHTVVSYGGLLRVLGKVNPIPFFKKFWPTMLVGFSTSSSNATIPVTMDACTNKLGAADKITSFTIPLGATINMDGTAIMQGVAAMFIAQVYGIHISLYQQLMIILTATLASIGTAGVPGAGIVMLSMVLQQVGLPLEGIALILSVDRLLDMMRTVTNITGDAVCTIIVSNSEKELDHKVYNCIGTSKEADSIESV
ncbi:Na+/H+-dicarboxylate symporter [Clostridium amylolyticum]|uniref:Na+/H+-dicarboxylate symporter n=1 Tax=Clostridium amylolyticum TaxID=1121298 RepID=A0A1M6JKC7_9CLOT|nr:dicarboxylate/amino acid:cation symporter [Clostridium amylolyticum]SHJ47147.1 Na+/H+-dicarboxylate symporter [Clostridium amylolyticum]